jgi:hypothetical protein
VGRNLEDLARISDLMAELHKKEVKLANLQKYVIDLKMVSSLYFIRKYRSLLKKIRLLKD